VVVSRGATAAPGRSDCRGPQGVGGRGRSALLLLFAACSTTPPAFRHEGVMREVMRGGQTQPRAALAEVAVPGTYAVGALAGLDGEFVVDDGAVQVAVDTADARPPAIGAQATLLTAARVRGFDIVALDARADLLDLENRIAAIAEARGATTTPIPFVLEGRGDVALHVARGACPHAEPVPGKEPARVDVADAPLRAIGFYIAGQEGVMTHMGTSLHVHATVALPDGRRVLGHVDGLAVAAGATLRVGK
jgi:hypothetical protein